MSETEVKTETEAVPMQPQGEQEEQEEKIVPITGRNYATGKRKNAIARVWIMPGSGKIKINKKAGDDYFKRIVLRMIVRQPFAVAECENQFDAFCTVKGGGLSGQAGALRHGISRALAERSRDMRGKLKAKGFITRDSRVVERKKYGRRKARRSFQFSKR